MIGEVFREGLELYKQKWLGLAGLAFIAGVISTIILAVLMGAAILGLVTFGLSAEGPTATEELLTNVLPMITNIIIAIILAVLVGLGFYATGLVYVAEEEVGIGEALKRGFGRLFHLLAVKILGTLIISIVAAVVGFIIGIVSPVAGVLLALVAAYLVSLLFVASDYLVVVERKGVIESLTESKHAVLKNYVSVLLTAIAIAITAAIVYILLGLIPLLGLLLNFLIVTPFYTNAMTVAFAREVLKYA